MTKTTIITSFMAAVILLGFSVPSTHAVPAEFVVNGDFETGDFTGWTVTNTGSGNIQINDGTFDPPGPTVANPPINGNFDAVTFQGGPGHHILSQQIVVPNNVVSAQLSWSDRIFTAAALSDNNQEARVQIRDASGTVVLSEIFSTNPGDPNNQPGPNARSFDVTALLQGEEGNTITLHIAEQDNLTFFNYYVDDVSLLIETNQVPDCSDATPSQSSIWPPNHKMVDITIDGATDPDGDPLTITIDAITQDEPTNDVGDGDTSTDGDGVGTDTAQIRAERSGTGDGRVYTIHFTADDGSGGTCTGSVTVGVPHDKKDTAVDSGQYVDSTIP